jgi:hypothetical protein
MVQTPFVPHPQTISRRAARCPRAARVVALVFACLFASTAAAQTNLRAWNRDGQTWLVWEDDQTFVDNQHDADPALP